MAELLLRNAYDDTYGIYGTTGDRNHPFVSVAPHKTEDVHSKSLFSSYIDRFADHGVNTVLGISFNEFLTYPRYEAEQILNRCSEYKRRKSETLAQVEQDLENMRT